MSKLTVKKSDQGIFVKVNRVAEYMNDMGRPFRTFRGIATLSLFIKMAELKEFPTGNATVRFAAVKKYQAKSGKVAQPLAITGTFVFKKDGSLYCQVDRESLPNFQAPFFQESLDDAMDRVLAYAANDLEVSC